MVVAHDIHDGSHELVGLFLWLGDCALFFLRVRVCVCVCVRVGMVVALAHIETPNVLFWNLFNTGPSQSWP